MLARLFGNSSLLEKLANEQAPRYCSIAIVIGAVVAIGILIIQFYSAFNYRSVAFDSSDVAQVKRDAYKSQTITKQNLFGRPDQVNLPQTQLQLVLRGSFTSNDPTLSSAIIETPDKKTQSFKVSSNVYGNTSLHAVYRDRVILSRNGELETLYFPTPQSTLTSTDPVFTGNQAPMISSDDVNLVRDNATFSEASEVARQLSSTSMTADQRKQLIRQRLQELRNRTKK